MAPPGDVVRTLPENLDIHDANMLSSDPFNDVPATIWSYNSTAVDPNERINADFGFWTNNNNGSSGAGPSQSQQQFTKQGSLPVPETRSWSDFLDNMREDSGGFVAPEQVCHCSRLDSRKVRACRPDRPRRMGTVGGCSSFGIAVMDTFLNFRSRMSRHRRQDVAYGLFWLLMTIAGVSLRSVDILSKRMYVCMMYLTTNTLPV
jgi:hypothetical protein